MAKTNIEIKQLESGFLVSVSSVDDAPKPQQIAQPASFQAAPPAAYPPPPTYYPPRLHAFSTIKEVCEFVTCEYEFI